MKFILLINVLKNATIVDMTDELNLIISLNLANLIFMSNLHLSSAELSMKKVL